MKESLLSILLICAVATAAFAQLDSVYHEVVYTYDGQIDGYPEGYSTYRIYAAMSDDMSWLTAMTPTNDALITLGCQTGEMFNVEGVDESPIVASDIGIEIILNPLLGYDSFVTIGISNASTINAPTISYVSDGPVMTNSLGTPGIGPLVDDAEVSWFLEWDESPFAYAGFGSGENNSVLVAQLTCPSDIQYRLVTLVERYNDVEEIGPDYIDSWNPFDTFDSGSIIFNYNPTLAYPTPSFIGCMDPVACNYAIEHTYDDGSCAYPGCADEMACNYDASAGCDDGTCFYELDPVVDLPASGWTLATPSIFDPCAFNEEPLEFFEDHTAIFTNDPGDVFSWSLCMKSLTVSDQIFEYIPSAGIFYNETQKLVIKADGYDPFNACVADLSGDGSISTADLLILLAAFGTACGE